MKDVIIIGAGLSGLSAAYNLQKQKADLLILEARERTGGRIYTLLAPPNNTPVEMGATWFAYKHTFLMSLLEQLKLGIFKQLQKGLGIHETVYAEAPETFTISPTEEPSYRLAGGTSTIVNALVEKVGVENIKLNTSVRSISDIEDHIEITDDKENIFRARHVIITIPPYLVIKQGIKFNPILPNELVSIMQHTHTWMSDSIKFGVVYQHPFWRVKGYSGTVFSQTGIATELYDHTNYEENRFALKGFLISNAIKISRDQRQSMVVAQLMKLLGKDAGNYLSYKEKVWANDVYTHAHYTNYIMPHQNNGHPVYDRALMNGKLYLSGSETSPHFGGYMDGAVCSGKNVAAKILNKPVI